MQKLFCLAQRFMVFNCHYVWLNGDSSFSCTSIISIRWSENCVVTVECIISKTKTKPRIRRLLHPERRNSWILLTYFANNACSSGTTFLFFNKMDQKYHHISVTAMDFTFLIANFIENTKNESMIYWSYHWYYVHLQCNVRGCYMCM